MFKPGAETGAGNSFYSNVQEKWTVKVLKHLSHGHVSLLPNPQPRQLYACFFIKDEIFVADECICVASFLRSVRFTVQVESV